MSSVRIEKVEEDTAPGVASLRSAFTIAGTGV